MTRTIQLRHVCVSASGLMNLQAALINRGTTRMPSKEGVNSTLVSNPVPVGSTIYDIIALKTATLVLSCS